MAVPEPIRPEGEFLKPGDPGYPSGQPMKAPVMPNGQEIEYQQIRETAARLLGRGYKRPQVARIMLDHLVPEGRNEEQRLIQARAKIRRWCQQEKFRDLIYHTAVVELDLEMPEILAGVGYKAKRGRVDAAKLALEVTGRHNPRGEGQVANITVQIANIPRPGERA